MVQAPIFTPRTHMKWLSMKTPLPILLSSIFRYLIYHFNLYNHQILIKRMLHLFPTGQRSWQWSCHLFHSGWQWIGPQNMNIWPDKSCCTCWSCGWLHFFVGLTSKRSLKKLQPQSKTKNTGRWLAFYPFRTWWWAQLLLFSIIFAHLMSKCVVGFLT